MSSPLTGLRAWVVQRITAVYLALFLIYALLSFALRPPASFEEWRAWFSHPGVSVATALFFGALLLHAWVGMRDVVLDYIHHTGLRFAVLAGLAVLLVAQGLWVLRILQGASV